MKRLLKFGLVIALVCVALVFIRWRRRGPSAPPPSWQPPIVEPAIRVAEDEGMTPPPEAPAGDVPLGSSGEPLVSQFAAPGAPEAEIEEQVERPADPVALAEEEGMTPPATAPAEDVAVGSDGLPLMSELAAPGAPEGVIEAERGPIQAPVAEPELADDEPMVALEGDAFASEEMLAPGFADELQERSEHFASPFEEDLPDFSALLEEAEDLARGEALLDALASETASLGGLEPAADPEFLTRYFNDLAATPDEAPPAPDIEFAEPLVAPSEPTPAIIEPGPQTPAPPPSFEEPTAQTPPDEGLLDSVEEALGDLAPARIVPPPRRTAESYLDEGNVYFNVGQYGLAIERYGQAIEMDRELTAAFYNRANAHTRAGNFELALADYDSALALQPNDADALNNRGMLHLYRSNYTAALADFNGALEADPTDTTVMVNRGLAHLHGGDPAAALIDFAEASRKDQTDAAAQYGAAQAAATMGNREEALKRVARALELDPAYAREAAGDPRLSALQGDEEFLRLLRQSGTRSN